MITTKTFIKKHSRHFLIKKAFILFLCSFSTINLIAQNQTRGNTPYLDIEWLIGNWHLEIPQGQVKMTFEWGANKSYIKYVGYNPGGTIEHEGIIVWHPKKRKIIELSAFTSTANVGTPAEAYFEITGKGKLIHYFTLFYPAGKKFKDGSVAPKGGKKVEYRQIWTAKGKNGLHDIFQTKRNGEWQLVNEKDKAGFNWQKQN